jgi:hypothetical protein
MRTQALFTWIKMSLRAGVCTGAMLLTTACVALLNASVPSDGYRVISNVPYGTHARQSLDIYVPASPSVPRIIRVSPPACLR